MNKRIVAAIVLVLTLLLGMVLFLLLHQPQKPVRPVRIHQAPTVTELVGVGMQLRMDEQTHAVVVAGIVANTPAAQAGIRSGRIVTRVDGISLEGKPLAECVNLIRGPVGTTVQLELLTPDRSQTNTVELIRKQITVPR